MFTFFSSIIVNVVIRRQEILYTCDIYVFCSSMLISLFMTDRSEALFNLCLLVNMNGNLITDDDITGILLIDNYITWGTYFVFNQLIFETSITMLTMLSLIFQFKCYFKLFIQLLICSYTQGCQLSRIWRDSHAFDLLLTHSRN